MALSVPLKRPQGRARRVARDARRSWSAYVFISPGLILFGLFTLFALGFAFYLSFHDWSVIEKEKPFAGLENYRDILDDARFHRATINTFYFTGGSVPLTMAIGLLIALMLNQPIRARGLFRTLYYLPVVTPFVVVAILWKFLYNADFGLFNYYLLKTRLIDEPLLWLSDKDLAMPSVILMSVYSGIGWAMILYLAGLQGIPEELYEAAKVDGAGAWQRFRYVTLPQLAPTTLFLLVISIIYSLQVFTQIFVMTGGGPVERTTTMVYFIYLTAFKFFEMGYATALAFFLFAMTLVFTLFQLRLYRRYGAGI
ncbi:MAG: sugar ABC transporter permease [Thermoleophilia bacterium]|nr:sugar ABC transporter permease [Thermoleophilia bacterium]